MEDNDFKKFMLPIMILILAVLSFFVIKPLLTAILFGLLLAYLFYPAFLKLKKKLKSETISALILVISTTLILLVPPLLLMPTFIDQLFKAYLAIRGADFSVIIFRIFPDLASSPDMTAQIIASSSHFSAKISDWLLVIFEQTLRNIPALIFGIVVVIFTFYFALKEGDKFKGFLGIIFPIPEEHKKRFFDKFSQVTDSVLYGELVVGLAQGLIAGIGYYLFGIPNALLFTVLTAIAGVIPVVGPWLVWIPVDIYLFINGQDVAGMQLLIYGLFVVNWVDSLLRPIVVARRAQMNPALALIGSIGGLYTFGVMGFVLGPLFLASLILLIEMYKDNKGETIVLKEEKIPAPQEPDKLKS